VADVSKGAAEELGFRVAEHLAQGAVDLRETPVEVVEGHADGGVVERAAEELFGLAELLLGPPALGDVYDGLDRPRVRAVRVEDGRAGGREDLLGPVGGRDGDLVR